MISKQLRPEQLEAQNENQANIELMRKQNDKMKAELKQLTSKLEMFVEKTRQRKNDQFGKNELDQDDEMMAKEIELKSSQHKVQYYKREIENMRRQLEGSYNIQKIIALEDEQKNKERILKQLQEEAESLLKVQQEQEKALRALNKEGEYDAKIGELGEELRVAKDQLRKLQFKQREDEKIMKGQHEQLVMLEEKCRKMRLSLKEKAKPNPKSLSKEKKQEETVLFNQEDFVRFQSQLKDVEHEKALEEKRLRHQVQTQESILKEQQIELQQLQQQVKEKEQEYRLNELKIKETKRQLPAKALKMIPKKPVALGVSQSQSNLATPQKSMVGSSQLLTEESTKKLPPAFPKSRPPKKAAKDPKVVTEEQVPTEETIEQ